MNAARFQNLGAYLSEFLRSLNSQNTATGRSVFSVQVLSEGIADTDLALLR